MNNLSASSKWLSGKLEALGRLDFGSLSCCFFVFTTIVLPAGHNLCQIAKVVLLICFVFYLLRGEKLLADPLLVVMGLFVAYSSASIIWSVYPETTKSWVITLLNWYAALLCLVHFVKWDKRRLYLILSAFVLSALFSGVYVIAYSGMVFSDNRVEAGFVSPGALATASASAILIIYSFAQENRVSRVVACVVAAVLFVFIVATSARRGLFLLILALLFFISFKRLTLIRIVALFTGTVVVLFVLYQLMMSNDLLYSLIGHRVQSLLQFLMGSSAGDASIQGRAGLIEYGISMFRDAPVFGNGLSAFGSAFLTRVGSWATNADNNYVELLADLGIVGFCFYYIPMYSFLIRTIKKVGQLSIIQTAGLALLVSMCVLDFATVWCLSRLGVLLICVAYFMIAIPSEGNK